MSLATPAIVTQSAVRRLPRLALLLLGLAYVLPGFLGREPWKTADVAALGAMLELAAGSSPWWSPSVLGLPADQAGLLPYWLGAVFVQWLPALSPDIAARIPFALLLALTLACTWYAVYHLARQPAALPVAFAFGGEAQPADYARALADAGLLALVACLGLAQLSHETTPDVARLASTAALLLGAARLAHGGHHHPWRSLWWWAIGLAGLLLSGAAWLSLVLGFVYRELRVKDLAPILLGVATNTATITGLIAAASVLSWALAFQGVPDLVVEWMKSLTDSPFVFLLLVIVMMLTLGMFLESISVLIVVVPLLMPVVNALGIDPIHFGVICTVSTVIGLVTPPVGPGLYIAMVQADIRMGALFRATLPFLIAVLAVLVLVAAVPQLSTWLPALTMSN